MTNIFFGAKKNMGEAFIGETRVAVTRIELFPMKVAQIKPAAKDGSQVMQVVFGKGKKHPSRSVVGHLKDSGVKSGKLREMPIAEGASVGQSISFEGTVMPGTIVTLQGTAKGKGFAGVMKRWNFAGGPRTHGQSDRARAPGSIGQGTTPGRVHRGKKMAGRMGSETTSVKNSMVLAVSGNSIWVTGPLPGAAGTLIKLVVTGQKDAPDLTFLNGYESVVPEPVVETPAAENSGSNATQPEAALADSDKNEETK